MAKVVTALIESGANVDATDIFLRTPLWHAAFNGYPAVVKILLTNKANTSIQDGNYDEELREDYHGFLFDGTH